MRKLTIGIKTLLVLAGASVLVASSMAPASAANTYVHNNHHSAVAMWYAPTTEVNIKAWIPNGTRFNQDCWVDHQWYTGNYYSNRWFYGQAFTGDWGYIHASFVINQQSVPHC